MKVTVNTKGIQGLRSDCRTRHATYLGVAAGVAILERAVRTFAPRRTGAVAAAQTSLASAGTRGETISFAVQGSRSRYARSVRREGHTTVARPALYEHFLRLGTRAHGGNRGVQPDDFRQRAFDHTKNQIVQTILATMVAEIKARILANALR